jgi:hypothetical protein
MTFRLVAWCPKQPQNEAINFTPWQFHSGEGTPFFTLDWTFSGPQGRNGRCGVEEIEPRLSSSLGKRVPYKWQNFSVSVLHVPSQLKSQQYYHAAAYFAI